ncbi:MAG: D-alanyl-D-alanine carboxypeptidase [Lachnospiraceae bacterium]|nr:D-alanyl-D-alanine carboxypeptidase [Lachnospiraceae bacterium]
MFRTGKRFLFKYTALILAAILAFCLFPPETVRASDPLTNHLTNWPQMSDINEDSAVLMDADNGAILYSLNRDTQRIPASITKIMTCLLVLEGTEMSDVVTMTEAGMAEAYSGSANVNPVLGEEFTVEQCLYMMMLKSANDIAAELAVFTAGSVQAFCDRMNERAAQIGCTGTHFNNPNGLPGDDHYTTAYDMALIMRECLRNDSFRQIIATTRYTVPPTNMTGTERVYDNHCRLIQPSDDRYYEYCIGGKTGYTDLAWRTLVTAAVKDGRTLICVTMHGPNAQDFIDTKNLFEYGFNQFSVCQVETKAEKGRYAGNVTIPNGFTTDSLLMTETENIFGQPVMRYTYEDNPVGDVPLTEKAGIADAIFGGGNTESKADQGSASAGREDGSASRESAARKSRVSPKILLGILVILFVILLTALIACIWISVRRARKRRARQQRRAAAKRRGRTEKERNGRPGTGKRVRKDAGEERRYPKG